jgi:hypothetical protein
MAFRNSRPSSIPFLNEQIMFPHLKDYKKPEVYLKFQLVPRSKHTPSQLYKTVS